MLCKTGNLVRGNAESRLSPVKPWPSRVRPSRWCVCLCRGGCTHAGKLLPDNYSVASLPFRLTSAKRMQSD